MELKITPFSCLRGELTIRGTEYRPEGENLPALILSHGFGGNGDGIAYYAEYFANLGYSSFIFDFCGGGPVSRSDGRFQDMTVLTEKADLEAVLAYVSALPYVDASRISLLGCSQGGFVSALVAAANPEKVSRLVLYYPALCIPEDARRGQMLCYSFDPQNVPEEIPAQLPPDAPFKMPNLGRDYVNSMMHENAFDLICTYPGPVLLVHGDADSAVPVVNSRRAQAAYNAVVPRRAMLCEISGANHGFRGQEDTHAMELAREFLAGGTNVLSVDVILSDFIREEQDGETLVTIPFGGTVSNPFFSGRVLPGAADVQRWKGKEIVRLCADYVLEGTDFTGEKCRIHIVNENLGDGWKPTVTTDSAALSFLNGAVLTESLENRRVGPNVRIFAKI